MSIGEKVLSRRLMLDMTQSELSRISRVHETVISKIEHSERVNLTVETLTKLASALRTTVSELTR
jgi:transcriptional regulator with XRE-family HTH domain